jgi:hypothetical protein
MTTKISETENKQLGTNSRIYDLQGRRVVDSQLKKGLYIVSGKKVAITRP